MRRSINKRTWIIGGVIGMIVVVAIVVVAMQMSRQNEDPYRQTETINETPSTTQDTPVVPETDSTDEEPAAQDTNPELDPTTVSTIQITSLDIEVSYVKGIGGFEYMVQRTASGTRYVEFRNQELAGTKCTDDSGPFASVLVNPSADESATLAKKTIVDGTTYGLSLAATTCTPNPDLLKQYQDSFSDAFHLLKKTAAN